MKISLLTSNKLVNNFPKASKFIDISLDYYKIVTNQAANNIFHI